jgi:transcription antitermination factor NusG
MLMTARANDQNDLVEPREGICYFVMLAEPNREMTAQANLVIRHVPFYLPTIFRPARLPAKAQRLGLPRADIAMPLFPGVVFIAMDIVVERLDMIRSAPGMRSQPFMKFGDREAVLRPLGMRIVKEIEAGERERYFHRKRRTTSRYIPNIGDDVSVIVNQILGSSLRGKVSKIDDRGRIEILAEIMKRTVRIETTANQIEPV